VYIGQKMRDESVKAVKRESEGEPLSRSFASLGELLAAQDLQPFCNGKDRTEQAEVERPGLQPV
jgi:hypothetical protein